MNAIKPTEYQERKELIPPYQLRVVSFRLGEEYQCVVDNVDPGAVLARAKAGNREEAERAAVEQAKELIAKTRRFE